MSKRALNTFNICACRHLYKPWQSARFTRIYKVTTTDGEIYRAPLGLHKHVHSVVLLSLQLTLFNHIVCYNEVPGQASTLYHSRWAHHSRWAETDTTVCRPITKGFNPAPVMGNRITITGCEMCLTLTVLPVTARPQCLHFGCYFCFTLNQVWSQFNIFQPKIAGGKAKQTDLGWRYGTCVLRPRAAFCVLRCVLLANIKSCGISPFLSNIHFFSSLYFYLIFKSNVFKIAKYKILFSQLILQDWPAQWKLWSPMLHANIQMCSCNKRTLLTGSLTTQLTISCHFLKPFTKVMHILKHI